MLSSNRITVLIWFDKHKAQSATRCHYGALQNTLLEVCVQGFLQDYLVRHAETDKTSRMLIHWSVAGTPAPIYATCWTRLAASVSWSAPHSANSVLHQVVLVLDAACGEPMSDLSGGDGGARPIGSAEGIRTVFLLLETGVQPVQFSIAQQPELHGASWMRILPGS